MYRLRSQWTQFARAFLARALTGHPCGMSKIVPDNFVDSAVWCEEWHGEVPFTELRMHAGPEQQERYRDVPGAEPRMQSCEG